MFEINDLKVSVLDKNIINDLNLVINDGEIHVLMGQNGTGKSTICKTILGDKDYVIESGNIKYKNVSINELSTNERAKLGIFLLNQNPITIEGVTNQEMLRLALASKDDKQVDIFKFNNELVNICKKLDLPTSFIHRNINEGASGGERKKNELMHMWILKPSFIILDELDSGLDVDALKIVSKSLLDYYKEYKPSILIITHHIQILNYIKPDYVHVLENGTIVESGDINLAKEIEKNGFNRSNKVRES